LRREVAAEAAGPFRVATMLNEIKKDYDEAANVLKLLQPQMEKFYNELGKYYRKGSDEYQRKERVLRYTLVSIDYEIELMSLRKVNHLQGTDAAVKAADELLQSYNMKQTRIDSSYAAGLAYQIEDLKEQEWGIKPDTTQTITAK
jgi:hypothetical protein